MKAIIDYDFSFKDERGVLRQLISSQHGWKQINFATSKKGVSRGGHYHKTVTETFYLIRGRVKVYIKNMKNHEEYSKVFENGDIFIIEPYDKHTVEALEDSEWVAFFNEQINNGDIYKE